MNVVARPATLDDLNELVRLYRLLAAEMREYHRMWELADGLTEPVIDALRQALQDHDTVVYLGTIDDTVFGFILGRSEPLLPQAQGERIGSIRFVFTEEEAREVGVGEAMRDALLEEFRGRGLRLFDAHVLPGHRLVKNFFESGGFSARSIVMHHRDG
jgi:ribosomal protein S18 acetylase RimI-like enzyme